MTADGPLPAATPTRRTHAIDADGAEVGIAIVVDGDVIESFHQLVNPSSAS